MILEGHQRLLWPYAGKEGMRSPGEILFQERCIKRLYRFASIQTRHEVLGALTIFVRDPLPRRGSKRRTEEEGSLPTRGSQGRRREEGTSAV